MEKTVLNVVIHQGGGYRFGVIHGEYHDSPATTVRIKNLIKGEDLVLPVESCFYRNGSIYSKEISDWIQQNGYERNAEEAMPLFKFTFERVNDEDVFVYVGFSGFFKEPNKNSLVRETGESFTYKKEELCSIVWEGITDNNTSNPKVTQESKRDFKTFVKDNWHIIIGVVLYFIITFMWGFFAGLFVATFFIVAGGLVDHKQWIKLAIVELLIVASPFVMCNPQLLPKDTVYSCSGWNYVTYFKIDYDNDITFGAKSLGAVETYELRMNHFYDDDVPVGDIRSTLFGVKVSFYDKYMDQFSGTYTRDH